MTEESFSNLITALKLRGSSFIDNKVKVKDNAVRLEIVPRFSCGPVGEFRLKI